MSLSSEQRMSRVDTAWLRMDSDTNLMMIVGVWLLDPAISLAVLRRRITERLLPYRRFGQRAVHDAHGVAWVDDPGLDIRRQVVGLALAPRPGQTERQALQQCCAKLAATPLAPDRPLWQFHLVPAYQGGCAVIVRIHHCVGDGLALIAVMNSITDGGQGPPAPVATDAPAHAAGPHRADDGDWLSGAVLRPLTGLVVRALGRSGQGAAGALDALAHPQQPLQEGLGLARSGMQVLADVAALALMADDTPTRLKGRPSGRKVVAWGNPLPLDQVKAVGKSLGCSVNDVLLACVSGAIGGWLRGQGDRLDSAEIRALVPVNLRPQDQAWQLGNHFGLAPLLLPIGISNPVERVYAVHSRMAALKGSYQPLLAYGMLALTGLLAKPLQDRVLSLFSSKTTAVMTNVPGPSQPLRFCGSALKQMMFWVPASGDVGVGVSILSYGGGVQFALMTDAALCADPQAIIDRFEPEFQQLLWLSLMLPWGERAAV